MALLGYVYPDAFPYNPTWRGGATHPALISRSAVVDHVDPIAAGGAWGDPKNLVTACNPCNSIKSDLSLDQLGWELRPALEDGWDGLISSYPALWEAANRPAEAFHLGWMKSLAEVA
jgi:HNH endonuclease